MKGKKLPCPEHHSPLTTRIPLGSNFGETSPVKNYVLPELLPTHPGLGIVIKCQTEAYLRADTTSSKYYTPSSTVTTITRSRLKAQSKPIASPQNTNFHRLAHTRRSVPEAKDPGLWLRCDVGSISLSPFRQCPGTDWRGWETHTSRLPHRCTHR